MRDAWELVEERGGYRLHECFIDATALKPNFGSNLSESTLTTIRILFGSQRVQR
jgi:hypothetical protein